MAPVAPPPPRIRYVVFDLMDTLVYDPIHREIAAFFGLSRAGFFQAVNHELYMQFECGHVTSDQLYRQLFVDGRCIDGPAFEQHLRRAYRWIDGMEEFLLASRSRSDVRLCLLSNYGCWYELVRSELGLDRFFNPETTFVSYQTGVRKPSALAYKRVTSALQCLPADCLLVDDRAVNCTAARELGWSALEFSDVAALQAAFATDLGTRSGSLATGTRL